VAHALFACSVHNRVNALRFSREMDRRRTTVQNRWLTASFQRPNQRPWGGSQWSRSRESRTSPERYADDLVILSRGKAKEALAWAQATLTRLGLTRNARKTSIRNAGKEQFDFLGYTFGPHFSRRTRRQYIGCSRRRKA
jgi:hypothetical protein